MKDIIRRETEILERRRFRAIELINSGVSQREAAETLKVTPGAISHWLKAYKEKGEDGLKSKKRSGRFAKLPEKKLSLLPQLLKEGAPAFGYSTNLWTTKRIAKLILKSIWCSLPLQPYWSPPSTHWVKLKKPTKKATERDEKAIRTWIENDWPRIKKKPKNRSYISLFRRKWFFSFTQYYKDLGTCWRNSCYPCIPQKKEAFCHISCQLKSKALFECA